MISRNLYRFLSSRPTSGISLGQFLGPIGWVKSAPSL